MNAREAKRRREAEESEFRAKVLEIVESQKGVIGAMARTLGTIQRDIEGMKAQIADLESEAMTVQ